MMMLALFASFVATAAMLMSLDPFLPAPRPGLGGVALTGLLVGVPGAILLVGLQGDPKLLAVAITLAVLGGACATDILRARSVNGYLLIAATVLVLVISSVVDLSRGDLPLSLLGLLVVGGAGAGLFAGGAFFARLRGLSEEALADEERGPAFGGGDVLVYALIGALLGPVWGLVAFLIGLFANAPMAIFIFLAARLRHRDTAELYLPYLPGIATGTMLVLLLIAVSH